MWPPVENWYFILNFLPWSRNFLCKNHDLYFKTQNLYYWKEISQILYPRTQNLYYRFCSTEKNLVTDSGIHRYSGLLMLSKIHMKPHKWIKFKGLRLIQDMKDKEEEKMGWKFPFLLKQLMPYSSSSSPLVSAALTHSM